MSEGTWGVRNTRTGEWLTNYHDADGTFHQRRNMHEQHAVNAAEEANLRQPVPTYEAQDMGAGWAKPVSVPLAEERPVVVGPINRAIAILQRQADEHRAKAAKIEEAIALLCERMEQP